MLYGLRHSQGRAARAAGGCRRATRSSTRCSSTPRRALWLPDGQHDVYLHPTAWAGWAGLLVTMINLLPIGQLDGGHIATAYFGNRYNRFARRLHRLMPFVGVGVFVWVRHARARRGGRALDEGSAVRIALFAALAWLVWYVLVAASCAGVGRRAITRPSRTRPLPASRKRCSG